MGYQMVCVYVGHSNFRLGMDMGCVFMLVSGYVGVYVCVLVFVSWVCECLEFKDNV